jgi:Protein of unknown function (DUF2948)
VVQKFRAKQVNKGNKMAKKLKLLAIDAQDLEIISAACQDALFLPKNAKFLPKAQRFSISINRFVWENANEAKGKRNEAILSFDGVQNVKAKGINPNSNVPLCLLNIDFIQDNEPPSGNIILKFAQDYELALLVECIDVTLVDIGQARDALAKPDHGI